MNRYPLLFSCALFCFSFACGEKKEAESAKQEQVKADAADAKPEAAAKKDEPATAKNADAQAEPAAEGGGDKEEEGEEAAGPAKPLEKFEAIGVTECDAYAERYRACIEHRAPEGERAALRKQLVDQVDSWRRMIAGNPDAKSALLIGCRSARAGAEQSSGAWGCEW